MARKIYSDRKRGARERQTDRQSNTDRNKKKRQTNMERCNVRNRDRQPETERVTPGGLHRRR